LTQARAAAPLARAASGTPLSKLDPPGSATIEETYKKMDERLKVRVRAPDERRLPLAPTSRPPPRRPTARPTHRPAPPTRFARPRRAAPRRARAAPRRCSLLLGIHSFSR